MTMRKKFGLALLLNGAILLVISIAGLSGAFAAQQCFGYGATTHENPLASGGRYGQQYTPGFPTGLLSVTMNISGHPANTGFFHFQIHETTAGVPNSTIVAGSVVQITSSTVPDRAIGTAQAFDCESLPPGTTFTFAAPVVLTAGQMYAFTVYQTTTFQDAQQGFVSGDFPGIAPGEGLECLGGTCSTHVGWTTFTHGGFNADIVYSLENELVVAGDGADTKIDSRILQFREFLQLTGDTGGLIFALGIVGLIFLFGLAWGVPFPILGMMTTMLVAAFARAEIIEPWIVLAVVAVAGMALVFKIGSGSGGSENAE